MKERLSIRDQIVYIPGVGYNDGRKNERTISN